MLKIFVVACALLITATASAQEVATSSPELTYESSVSVNSRPLALIPLYISFATLQLLDARSTTIAINQGARELNPLVRSFNGDPIALGVLKAGTTVATIALTEKLWRGHNRTAAVLSMVAVNGVYAAVVAHNYRTASGLDGR